MAAKIAMIATTIISSIKVKPREVYGMSFPNECKICYQDLRKKWANYWNYQYVGGVT